MGAKMSEVVIVTGSSRGIGAATARLLGARGASVVVNYRTEAAAAEAVASDVRAAGGRAHVVGGDMGEEADVIRLFEETDRVFGRVTGLVNNAGVSGSKPHRIEDLNFDSMMRMLRVNIAGVLICTREAVKRMSTAHGGSGGAIVNVSSMGALTGMPSQFVEYAASKAGCDAATIGSAAELARQGIRVNGVRPGVIDTDILAAAGYADPKKLGPKLAMGRVGTPVELAEAIVWLLSDKASYVSSAIVDVPGIR